MNKKHGKRSYKKNRPRVKPRSNGGVRVSARKDQVGDLSVRQTHSLVSENAFF